MKTIKTALVTMILAATFSANADESKMKFDPPTKTGKMADERKPNSDELANHSEYNKYESAKAEKRMRWLDRWTDRVSAE